MFESTSLNLTGLSPDGRLVEIVEVSDHPWFVGVQFHPELKSRPTKAHPLFRDFIKAVVDYHLKKSQFDTLAEKDDTVKRESVG